jgi:hypothetical protein
MKTIVSLLLISLLSTSVSAGVEQISIKDFSFHYDGQNGQGSFSKIGLKTDTIEFNAADYHIDLTKSDTHVTIAKPDTKIKLKTIDGDMLSSLGQIEVDGLNVTLVKNRELSINATKAHIEIGDGSHSFDHVALKCLSGPSRNGDVLSFLLPCMKYGVFTIPEISLSKESKNSMIEAFDIQTLLSQYGDDLNISGLAPKKLKDIKLTVNHHGFDLRAKVKLLFNLKVKGSGKIYYHALNSEVEVKLDKLKVGFLGIKNKVLKAVRKASIKNVRVSGHSIFISL